MQELYCEHGTLLNKSNFLSSINLQHFLWWSLQRVGEGMLGKNSGSTMHVPRYVHMIYTEILCSFNETWVIRPG